MHKKPTSAKEAVEAAKERFENVLKKMLTSAPVPKKGAPRSTDRAKSKLGEK
jgi:hypothetical protein